MSSGHSGAYCEAQMVRDGILLQEAIEELQLPPQPWEEATWGADPPAVAKRLHNAAPADALTTAP